MNQEFVFSPITGQAFTISMIIIIVAAIFLTAITVRAYRITHLKKMIYLVIAFALFAISYTLNLIDQDMVDIMPDDLRYVMFGIVHVIVMLMFFLAIIKK